MPQPSPSAPTGAIELHTRTSFASIVPARGALITRWSAGGTERLYLDEATLADPTKNVRGGIPLLFPSPGKLEDGRFQRAGKSGAMKQHGFARDLPWAVSEQEAGSITLSLRSTPETRAVFAWDFAATLKVVLSDASLRLAFRTENTGTEAMPYGFGIHPYFHVHDKARATISTKATRAYDNVAHEIVPFRGFSLASGETDMHLLDHGSFESVLASDSGSITVRTSPEFGRWVVWTLPGKDFVCLEPWTAPGNALNTGEGLIELAPGESKEVWIELVAGQR